MMIDYALLNKLTIFDCEFNLLFRVLKKMDFKPTLFIFLGLLVLMVVGKAGDLVTRSENCGRYQIYCPIKAECIPMGTSCIS